MLFAIFIPFAGTILGAACVFFFRSVGQNQNRMLTGFASGVMIAASVWSLLIPALNQSAASSRSPCLSFVPAVAGFMLGICFLLLIDGIVPHLHMNAQKPEGVRSGLSRHAMMLLAVTIHNIPEGMAVGVIFSAMMNGESGITLGAALALAVGIAIQNFPEGAIVSIPLHSAENGMSKARAFLFGLLSGIVEPIGTVLVMLMSSLLVPVMPYFLGFAAGAMMYVVVEELIPEMSQGEHSNKGVVAFAVGFCLMMVLDVVFG